MAYTKQTWTDGVSKLNATRMQHIEDGLEAAATVADAAIPGPTIDNSDVAANAAIAYSKLNLSGSIVNADISTSAAIANSKLGSPPMCKAKRSTALSISDNTWTLLTLDGEDFDTDSIHSTSSNTNRLTCQTAGKYAVVAFIQWDANTTGMRGALIQKNSEVTPALASSGAWVAGLELASVPSSTGVCIMSLPAVVDMAANDYLTVVVVQTSGGALNAAVGTYFSMWKVG